MPTYDYQCDDCDHTFEEFQSITAELLTDCPECKKPTLRRLFGTGAAIVFKGSGFYETDYRSESYKQGAKKESESKKSSGDSAKTGSGGDSKGGSSSSSSSSSPGSDAKS